MVRSLCPFYSADLSHFSKDNSPSFLQQLMYYCDCESKHCHCSGATKKVFILCRVTGQSALGLERVA